MILEPALARRRDMVERTLEARLPTPEGPAATTARAMRYAVLGGGKRLRPLLAIAACEACGGAVEDVLASACALEMIHGYSLVHDDLPAMDDDAMRRGRATVHRAFGEAEAILAGDALLTLAFEILGSEPPGTAHATRRADSVVVVARAAGLGGMVGGQQADLEAEGADVDRGRLEWIHRHKTGALLSAAAEVGAIHAGAPPPVRAGLGRYGQALGLAFQIADDILDRTATLESLGKTPGKDSRSGKATWPRLFGLEASQREAASLVEAALDELRTAGIAPDGPLEELARAAVRRTA